MAGKRKPKGDATGAADSGSAGAAEGLPGSKEEAVTREPFRPAQDQVAITEELTGVRLDLELCGVCSRNRGVGDHHIVFRSKGGHEGPTIPVCETCHRKIHMHEWTLELLERGMQLLDREGTVIWRLMAWPLAGEPGEFVQLLDRVTDATKLMPEIAPALLPWQAVEVFNSLRALGEGGWRAQTRLIGEMYQYRMPGWSGPEKVEALARFFTIRRSQAYNHLQIATAFRESTLLDDTQLSMGYVLEASRTEEPDAWLRLAQQRKVDHPAFSRDDLKEEIVKAGARKWEPSPAVAEAAQKMVYAECSHCGTVGWHKKLPIGSDGRPVNIEDYG